jgi:small subunit ribosomal protein S28e
MTEEKKKKPEEEAEPGKKEAPKEGEKPKSKEKVGSKGKKGETKEAPKEEASKEQASKKKSTASVEGATPGQVVKVFKKVGLYGECYQVLVRVLEGRDKGNLLRRNVRGPVKENDTLMLKETERDVRAV